MKKVNLITLLFYFAYSLMLFSRMFEKIEFLRSFLDYARYFSYLILLFDCVLSYKKSNYRDVFIKIVISFILIIASLNSGSNNMLTLYLFLIAYCIPDS